MGKAILIPVNPQRVFRTGPFGNVTAYRDKIKKQGAVFWQLVAPGDWVAAEFPHPEIRRGYLYDRGSRRVGHSISISGVRPISEIPIEEYRQYGLGNYEDESAYLEHSELFYVFTVTEIRELDSPLALSDFRKYGTDDPVKLVRNYCIVEDPLSTESHASSKSIKRDNDPVSDPPTLNISETELSEGQMGHGVLFYYEVGGEKLPIAFLEGYEWLHAEPHSVNVLLFKNTAAKSADVGVASGGVVKEMIEFIREFMASQGKLKQRECITTWWNA